MAYAHEMNRSGEFFDSFHKKFRAGTVVFFGDNGSGPFETFEQAARSDADRRKIINSAAVTAPVARDIDRADFGEI